ncbi:aspartate--tRNA ligase [Guggenheimella bovis]
MAEQLKRTHYAGLMRIEHVGETVVLAGWVQKKRNLGSLIFVDLRDREGMMQLVFNEETDPEIYEKASSLGREFVITVEGEVAERSAKNATLPTGDVELLVKKLIVHSESEVPPIFISDDDTAKEELRLKYRYLDLRKKSKLDILRMRSKMNNVIRNFYIEEGFIEFETPILCKPTPEGARDYLVPARLSPGHFYALPQSPQIFKQLLMIGGADRYFQIARCFRDEDLRADRQPEFTQLDTEYSFVTQEDVLDVSERMLQRVFKEIKGVELTLPLPRIKYLDAMERYGTDKPDTRFGLLIQNFDELFTASGFNLFRSTIEEGGTVRGIFVEGENPFSKKELKNLENQAKTYGAKGLAHVIIDDEVSGSIQKFLSEDEITSLREMAEGKKGIYFFVSDKKKTALTVLGNLRNYIAKEKELYDPKRIDALWVVDFPAFEYDEESGQYIAQHHPFTAPKEEDIPYLYSGDLGKVMANCYDTVINGYELASGSIRIHDSGLQSKIFELLGFTPESAKERFGFFIDALKYGTPPHGGIAYGLDRLAMILADTDSIRDVVAFPKTLQATDLMSDAPGTIETIQLDELHIQTKGVPCLSEQE